MYTTRKGQLILIDGNGSPATCTMRPVRKQHPPICEKIFTDLNQDGLLIDYFTTSSVAENKSRRLRSVHIGPRFSHPILVSH